MQNFGTTLTAVESAENSMGSASKENERAMDSLQGKIQELKSAFVTLATNTINSQTVKSIVSLGTTMLKFANSDVGQVIIKVIGLVTALKTASKAISMLGKFTGISSAMKSATIAFSEASAGAIGFTATLKGTAAATKSLTVALLSNPLFWGTVAITAVTAIINKYDELQQKKIDLVSSTQDEIKTINDESKEIENLSNEMQKAYDSADSLKEKKSTLKTYQQQLIDKYGDEITSLTNVKNANDLLNKSYLETVGVLEQVEKGLLDKQIAALNESKSARDDLLNTETFNKLANKSTLEDIKANEDLASTLQDVADKYNMTFGTNKFGDLVLKGNAENLVRFYQEMENEISKLDDSSQELWGSLKNQSALGTKSLEEDYNKFSQSVIQADDLKIKKFIKNNWDSYSAYKEILDKEQQLVNEYNSAETEKEKQTILNKIKDMQESVDKSYKDLYSNANDTIQSYLNENLPKIDISNMIDWNKIEGMDASALDSLIDEIEKTGILTDKTKEKIYQMWKAVKESGDSKALEVFNTKMKDLGITINDSAANWKDLKENVKSTKELLLNVVNILSILSEQGVNISDEVMDKLFTSLLDGEITVQDFLNRLEEEIKNSGGDITNIISQTFEDSISSVTSAISEVGKIQEKVDSLNSAIDEFNTLGGFSADTLNSLISNDLLQYLTFTENGVKLNTDALNQETEAAKQNALAQIQTAYAADVLALANGEVEKMSSGAKSVLQQFEAQASTIGSTANAQTAGLYNMATAMAAVSAAGGDTSSLQQNEKKVQALNNYYNKLTTSINNMSVKGTKASKSAGTKGSSGKKKSSSSKDTWKEEFESKYKALQHELNMEQITEEQYTNELESLYKKYFSNKTKYSEEYNKYEEEVYKKRKEIVKDAFQKELDELDHKQTMNMISERDYTDEVEKLYKKYFANRKEFLDEYTKYEEKVYESRASYLKADYDAAISVATDVIDKQISELEKQKSALEKVNDETDKAIELEKLKNDLYNAQNQKNIRTYYAGLGWVWEADKEAISDAEKALEDFEVEQKTDEIDKQIDSLNELKDNWSSIASDYESQQDRINAAVKFGSDFEQKVLSGRLDYLKSFVQSYNYEMDKLNPLTGAQQYAKSQLTPNSSYANGTTSAIGGLSLVGEKGAELRILNKGDGIIPAELTENLMRWGTINPINMVKAGGIPLANSNNNTSNNMNFNISNLTLPNVSDSNNFISGLRQYATIHTKRG